MARGNLNCGSRVVWPVAIALAAILAPAVARACNEVTLCVTWNGEFIDNGFGEDYGLDDTVPAAGARVIILRPAPESPVPALLNEDGCVAFDTEYNYGHRAMVFADAVVGGVQIRAFANDVDSTMDRASHWNIELGGVADGDLVSVPITNSDVALDPALEPKNYVPVGTMMAAATLALMRFDALQLIPGPSRLRLVFKPAKGNARCSCGDNDAGALEIGPDSFQEKFVMAHELGHFIHAHWAGGVGLHDYSYGPVAFEPPIYNQPNDLPCRFAVPDPVAIDGKTGIETDAYGHVIRSAEYASGAVVEGIAHFLAAIAFNDITDEEGWFHYYKELDVDAWKCGVPEVGCYQDFVDNEYTISLLGGATGSVRGGTNRWVAEQCSADWSYSSSVEIASELDYLRFWWRFATEQSGSQPSLSDIMGILRDADPWTEHLVWDSLYTAADAAGFGSRFSSVNDEQGVYNAN